MKRMIRPLLLALALLAAPLASQAGVFISVNLAPPALPVYEQPLAPGDGYIWTPGYWAWDPDEGDYYWVPGTWVLAPEPGLLWTPGYWGWSDSVFIWHAGYWGPHVGFYGGVNYGYGYNGDGYHGGEWRDGHFWYNRSVNNVNITNIHNTYNQTVINNVTVNRVSYNGGQGGLTARENEQQRGWANERHIEPTSVQERHRDAARADRSQFAKVNQGRPAVFATSHAGEFKGQGVVSRGQAAPFHPANGAYTKGGQPGGSAQHGAPAYVQHQREAEGQHTPIAPQARQQPQQHGGAPAYVQHERAPENMQHTPVQTQRAQPQQHFNQPEQHFNAPQQRPPQQFHQQPPQQFHQQPPQQFHQQPPQQFREQPQQQFHPQAQPQFHEQPHMQQPMQQPHVQQAPHPQGGQPRQEHH